MEKSTGRRWLAVVTAMLAAVSGGILLAPVIAEASPSITASVDCAGKVNWHTQSFEFSSNGTNPEVRITYRSTVDEPFQESPGSPGEFTAENNYQFGGSFNFPVGQPGVWVFVTAVGTWGNGVPGSPTVTSGFITPPSDCGGRPSVSAVAECVNGAADVTVTVGNVGGPFAPDITFAFTNPDVTKVVAAGTSTTVVRSAIPDSVTSISYTVNGEPASVDISRSNVCAPGVGALAVSVICSSGDRTITLTLTHVSGGDVVFVITDPTGGPDRTVTLTPADAPKTEVIMGVADTVSQISYTANGVPASASLAETVTCDGAGKLTPICFEVDQNGTPNLWWFRITNPTGSSVDYTWSQTSQSGTATVAGGGLRELSTPSGSNVTLKVFGDVVDTMSFDSTQVCTTTVVFKKELKGQPPTGETYTILVSRLLDSGSYDPEITFDLNAGETKEFALPSGYQSGISYKISEPNMGTANVFSVTPETFALTGNKGETVSAVITNYYASVSLDKQVSSTTVIAGDTLSYTIVATNTGGMTLDPVVISDRLPAGLTLVSSSVAGGNGSCKLLDSTTPQLVSCDISGALTPGSATPAITLVTNISGTLANNTILLNQAKVVGAWVNPDGSHASPGIEPVGGDLSCLPAVPGTVCDLSATVGSTVSSPVFENLPVVPTTQPAPTIPTTVDAPRLLPRTGSSSSGVGGMALTFVSIGAALLLIARRRRVA